VSLPHFALGQYDLLPTIPVSQLKPGDLVFFYPPTVHHVGIYIGHGRMIEAPHTGDVVKISSIYRRGLIGGGRPTVK
jgi:cell wall-associated NlpC family hydrolase